MRILGAPIACHEWGSMGSSGQQPAHHKHNPPLTPGSLLEWGGEGGPWVPMEAPNVCRDPTGGVGLRLHQPRAADQGTGSGDLRAAVPAATVGWRAEEPLRGCPGGQDLGSHRPDPKKSPEFGVCGGGFPAIPSRDFGVWGSDFPPHPDPNHSGFGVSGWFSPLSAFKAPSEKPQNGRFNPISSLLSLLLTSRKRQGLAPGASVAINPH